MKVLVACIFLVAVAQAAPWANLRPVSRSMPVLRKMPEFNGKIVGGELATTGQIKYQVGIFVNEVRFCGGSLIADNIVLTSGFCVLRAQIWEVHAGALFMPDGAEAGRVIVTSSDATVHEDYGDLDNDIAVIRLPEAVSGPNIATVRLPSRSMASDTFAGSVARVSGWGMTSDSSAYLSPNLRFVDVTVITNAECANFYGDYATANTICTDASGGTATTCNGDVGGPLVITEADGEVTEVGIFSFDSSLGCESGYPAGFTRVTQYLNWLETNAGVTIRP